MDITVTLTADEAIEMGIWDKLCAMRGLSIWIVNEGAMPGEFKFNLTKEEASDLGLTIKGDKE